MVQIPTLWKAGSRTSSTQKQVGSEIRNSKPWMIFPSAIPKANCVYSSALLAVLFKVTAHNFPIVQRGVFLGSFPVTWNAYINKNHRGLKVMHCLHWNAMRHLEFGRRLVFLSSLHKVSYYSVGSQERLRLMENLASLLKESNHSTCYIIWIGRWIGSMLCHQSKGLDLFLCWFCALFCILNILCSELY